MRKINRIFWSWSVHRDATILCISASSYPSSFCHLEVWMVEIRSSAEWSHSRPMINRDAREIELLCRDNNKWCTHNHRASLLSLAVCTPRRHFDTRSPFIVLFPNERANGAAVCSILPLVAKRFSRRYGQSDAPICWIAWKNLLPDLLPRALFRGRLKTHDSYKTFYSPSAVAFHLIAFLYVTRRYHYVNSPH